MGKKLMKIRDENDYILINSTDYEYDNDKLEFLCDLDHLTEDGIKDLMKHFKLIKEDNFRLRRENDLWGIDNAKLRRKVEANIDVNRIDGLDEKINELVSKPKPVHREVTRMIREKYPDVFNKLPSREEHEALKKEVELLNETIGVMTPGWVIANEYVQTEDHEALEQEVVENRLFINGLKKQVAELEKNILKGEKEELRLWTSSTMSVAMTKSVFLQSRYLHFTEENKLKEWEKLPIIK